MRKFVFFIFILFFALCSYAKVDFNICLAGSSLKVYPSYGEAFYNGAELALNNLKITKIQLNIKKFYYSTNPLAPIKALDDMLKENCHAVLGFNSTNELITISKKVKKEVSPYIFSMYGELTHGLENIEKFKTMQVTQDKLIKKLTDFIEAKQLKIKRAFIATVVDREGMNYYKKLFLKYFNQKGIKYETIDLIERPLNIESFKEKYFNSEYDTFIVLTRVSAAAMMMDTITKKLPKEKWPVILGTASFGSSGLPIFLESLNNKDITAYFSRQNIVHDTDLKYKKFFKDYLKKYKVNPMIISAKAFDTTNYLLKGLRNYVKGEEKEAINIDNFYKTLSKITHKGVTGVNFKKDIKLEHTKSFIIKISKRGYDVVYK